MAIFKIFVKITGPYSGYFNQDPDWHLSLAQASKPKIMEDLFICFWFTLVDTIPNLKRRCHEISFTFFLPNNFSCLQQTRQGRISQFVIHIRIHILESPSLSTPGSRSQIRSKVIKLAITFLPYPAECSFNMMRSLILSTKLASTLFVLIQQLALYIWALIFWTA